MKCLEQCLALSNYSSPPLFAILLSEVQLPMVNLSLKILEGKFQK